MASDFVLIATEVIRTLITGVLGMIQAIAIGIAIEEREAAGNGKKTGV